MARSFLALVSGAILLAATVSGEEDVSPLVPRTWNGSRYACKVYYDDRSWPNPSAWNKLNESVGGNLVVDVPPGAPCHNKFQGPLGTVDTYDEAQCAEVTTDFPNEQWTSDQPAASLWTYFTNDTCRPTTNRSDPCTLGYYPVYVITATDVEHVRTGILFARQNGLRLVIRNTGHDFIGRSTGWGTLAINTHSFQDVKFLDSWDGPGGYTGPAATIGAGVQGRALLTQAHALNPPRIMVVGECPTVGAAGGLPGGGGHGPLTTLKGWAVDSALQFTVVTANGTFLTANDEENPDLFWALKGGGPSTYAVILSATYKTYADEPSAGIIMEVNGTYTNDTELFWQGVRVFHKYSNRFVQNGLYIYFELGSTGQTSLRIHPIVAAGKNSTELTAVVQPLLDEWEDLGLNHSFLIKDYPTTYDLYIDMFEDEAAGGSALTGGWMFTHQDVEDNNDAIAAALRAVIDNGGFMIGHVWDAGHGVPEADWARAATHPRFRQASDFVITSVPLAGNAPLAEKQAAQSKLTSVIDEGLRRAGPNGATYCNEADPFQPNWQDHFWGPNYDKLATLKKQWDPDGVFYAVSMPGTEDWIQIETFTRLCKKIT